MAHIVTEKRSKGTVYIVRWRDQGSFRQRTFTVKREAERHAERVEAELEIGASTALLVKNTRTFRAVAEDALAAIRPRLKARTYEGYLRYLGAHVYPTFGARRIGTITRADVEGWIAALSSTPSKRTGKPLHPASIKHAFQAASMVFKYAARHRLIAENPALGTVLPRVRHEQKFEPVFLSAQEVEALAEHLAGHAPDDLFVRLAAYTGLRAGEMLGLQVRDVNLLRRTLDVKRTYQHTRDGWVESSPKSDKSIRTVPLRRVLVDDLTDYLAEHPHRDDPTASLWPGRNYAGGGEWRGGLDWSKRMDYDSFYRRRFREAARAIGRPTLRFHDLRHTAASLFAASGMPLARVARVLGHADTTMTYKVYLHFFPDDFTADMERLDAYIAPTQRPTEAAPIPLRAAEG